MRRRTFLASTAVALAAPAIARGEASQVLTFVPQADLAVLDPDRSPVDLSMTDQRKELLVHYGLFVVDMHAVIGNVTSRRNDAVPLRAQILLCIAHLRQQRGASLDTILLCETRSRHRRSVLRVITTGSIDCLLQCDDCGDRGGCDRLRCLRLRSSLRGSGCRQRRL